MNNCLRLNEAQNQGKAKVVNTNGDEWVFEDIYSRDGVYFGLDGTEETRIDTTLISCIYLKNVKGSRNENLILFVAIVGAIIGLNILIWSS